MKKFKKLAVAASVAALFAAATGAHAFTVTNPYAGWEWSPLAVPDTTTYGQVFMTPDAINTSLDSFTFWMVGSLAQAYAGVGTWTGTGIGTSLWQSSSFAASAGSLTAFSVSTGGLNLVAGQQYVAYFSTDILGNSGGNQVAAGTQSNGFAWDNSGGGGPLNNNWNGCHDCNSIQYVMEFSAPNAPIPEPETYAMMLAGLGLLGLVRRRKQQAAA